MNPGCKVLEMNCRRKNIYVLKKVCPVLELYIPFFSERKNMTSWVCGYKNIKNEIIKNLKILKNELTNQII
jgi:hypothetical protein